MDGHNESIIDRFFLGGDNLRGFASGGAGPHSVPIVPAGGIIFGCSDSVGGRFIYTQSTELRFPLPISADLGLSGRAFVDVGGLSEARPGATKSPGTTTPTRIQGGVTQQLVGAQRPEIRASVRASASRGRRHLD